MEEQISFTIAKKNKIKHLEKNFFSNVKNLCKENILNLQRSAYLAKSEEHVTQFQGYVFESHVEY